MGFVLEVLWIAKTNGTRAELDQRIEWAKKYLAAQKDSMERQAQRELYGLIALLEEW